ncbi:MAG TPA: glycerophosphodiester phosphodiesterase family protein [Roseiflexaceae bacterium]|nr:glycerophosphodiester phosphodiesterase family protein [Roseiflexaceae bacterium]
MTLVIAHRGASAYAPENTIAAMELAVRQRADMIELDVQRSADGVLMVFHDEETRRWDGRRRRMVDCTYAELQQVSIRGERIPTLPEVCAFAREHNIRLNVELKQLGIGADVARVLRDERVEQLVLISSFAASALLEMRHAMPHIPVGYLMGTDTFRPGVRFRESWPFIALRNIGAQAWHPTYQIPLAVRILPLVQRAGYRVNVWTVNDPALMRKLIALGADGIITDRPDTRRQLLDEQAGVVQQAG